MRALCLVPLSFALVACIPGSASAVQVEVSYMIKGRSNSTNLLGGAIPTRGTATLRWMMTSLNGLYDVTGPATIRTLKITSPGFLSFSSILDAEAGTSVPEPIILAAASGPHGAFVSWRGYTYDTGIGLEFVTTSFSGSYGTMFVSGMEVGRSLVPEPSTPFLLALGLCGVVAGRTVWRRKDQHST